MEEKNKVITDEMIKEIANMLVLDLRDENEEEIINKIDEFIDKLSKEFMDERDYVLDLRGLYNELKEVIPEVNAKATIFNLYFNNIDIILELRNKNINNEKIKTLREKRKQLIDYVSSIKDEAKEQKNKRKEEIDISFYIEFIEDSQDDSYINILPTSNDKESLKIIDSILSYYLKEINTLKYLLSLSDDNEYIYILEKNNNIFCMILEYKTKLLTEPENNLEVEQNEVVYYMNGDLSYLYSDIVDSPEIYASIKTLVDSIKNGSFKNIRYFTNNGKTKGLVEVRDIRNSTRVLFDIVGYKKYCIIGAIIGKKETNSIYKDRLISRYTKYKLERNNYVSNSFELKKVLRGDDNE